jgi:hypothetical protein
MSCCSCYICLTIFFTKVVGNESAVQFEVTIVLSSSTTFIVTLIIWVGSEKTQELNDYIYVLYCSPPDLVNIPGICFVHRFGARIPPFIDVFVCVSLRESFWVVGSAPHCGACDGRVPVFDVKAA